MNLNTIKPAAGATQAKKRVGRGIGSGLGKTCGRGHKGQKARAGGFHKLGFEGGQMPLQRRLPKTGFTSRISLHAAEVRSGALDKLTENTIDLKVLQDNGIVSKDTKQVKVFLSGDISRAITVKGLKVTKGVKAQIEQHGGKVE